MIETYYRFLRHDPEGRLVKDTSLIPSHSYVIQFLEMFAAIWSRSDKNATDVNGAEGVLVDVSEYASKFFRVNGGLGNDTYGVVVGTNAGTMAEDNENYALDTKILHDGAGAAGKLNYQATAVVAPHVDGASVDLHVSRTFRNETGVTITVKEIGIIIKNTDDVKYHLILRDVVSDEDVLDGETLTVIYTLRSTA